jgi:hypothetical protein
VPRALLLMASAAMNGRSAAASSSIRSSRASVNGMQWQYLNSVRQLLVGNEDLAFRDAFEKCTRPCMNRHPIFLSGHETRFSPLDHLNIMVIRLPDEQFSLHLMLTQAMLGFLPDAPRNKLYVDPLLPEWLPDITIRDLRVGRHKFDIRFWREGERTEFEVLNGDASLVERCEVGVKAAQLRDRTEPI